MYDNNKMQPNNAGSNENDQSHLTEQLATRLVQGIRDDASKFVVKPIKACIAVAGGGSNAAASIASTPGASSLLLESIVTYDRRSYAEFVSQNIIAPNANEDDGGWWMDLENNADNNGQSSSSSSTNSNESSTFQFCSTQASILLSRSALHRSLQLTPSFQGKSLHCIGVACTSFLVGKLLPPPDKGEGDVGGRNGRKSRAYIACSTLREGTLVWEVELDDNKCSEVEGSSTTGRRLRSQEESVVSNLILLLMMRYREQQLDKPLDRIGGDDFNRLLSQILDRDGDAIAEKRIGHLANDSVDINNGEGGGKSAALGASQIINGGANVVAVLPVPSESNEKEQEQPLKASRMETLFSDNNIPFPRDVLVVPGSFNPPHRGHVALANAAVSALRRLRKKDLEEENNGNDAIISSRPYSRYSSLSTVSSASASSSSSILKNLWDTVDQQSDEQYDPTVLYEMSVTNADKPPLDPSEVERRVNVFTSLPSSEMPKDWAVILTNAPLFSQKTSILDDLISDNGDGSFGSENQGSGRKMSFVLGTDTMVRIINPKYYGNSRENMLAALVDMKEKGVHFIVGGRLEQGSENRSRFVNGEEEVKSLPLSVQEMFTLLTEEEFRLDISSTELRKRMEHE
eukprot:CAMPEP_0172303298 /NCGR_PEP_ID=MMETSP1058-20130122/4847_1 /TAXON_ID=83371 /ORGANISM="Detonula confervacea, Strain CCMP 353" /LENGTH=629 /DNA_ID=CAMNT_0013014047 /DNA_START=464 /DNA_END=2353 /DNA_ORIENTATION=-